MLGADPHLRVFNFHSFEIIWQSKSNNEQNMDIVARLLFLIHDNLEMIQGNSWRIFPLHYPISGSLSCYFYLGNLN